MANLRSLIDGAITVKTRKKEVESLKLNDQVVLQRKVGRTAKSTQEVMAGTIVAMSEDGQRATVTLPRAGGRSLRTTVPVDKLRPAAAVFGRAAVHANPGFRQITRFLPR